MSDYEYEVLAEISEQLRTITKYLETLIKGERHEER